MLSVAKVVFLASAVMSLPSYAENTGPSPADYGALPTTQLVAVSPDGKLIAYRKTTDAKDAIVVYALDEHKLVLAFDASKVQPRNLYFINNDQLFLRASVFRRVEGFRGKFDLSTGYVFNISDNNIRQLLIPGDQILAGQTGLGDIVGFTPDGRYALMPAYSDTDNLFPDSEYTLYKVSLKNKFIAPTARGGKNVTDFFVDADGVNIAQEVFDQEKNIHKILSKINDSWVEIYKEETKVHTKVFLGITSDFKSLVFLEVDNSTGFTSYNTMSLSDGKITNSLLASNGLDVADVVVNLQRVVLGVRYSGFVPSYKFFDAALEKKVTTILAQFPEQSISLTDWSPDFRHIVVFVQGSSYAGDYFLFSDGREPVLLASAHAKIKDSDVNPIGNVTFKARDGFKIPTLITIPKDSVSNMKNLPAVVLPHGGPAANDMVGFDYFAQALASQGYLVIQPQFRGSTGFGYAHRSAGHGEWGKMMQNDLSDALAFFTKRGMVDPGRVCIVGASYGGYAALAGGAFTPELYQCVVSINGVSDLNTMLEYDKDHYGEDSETADYWKIQLAKGEPDETELNKISPAKHANSFTAPVLLIHAKNDRIVAMEQSEIMQEALTKAKKPVQLYTLDGDDHHLSKGSTRVKALQEVVDFVNKYLK